MQDYVGARRFFERGFERFDEVVRQAAYKPYRVDKQEAAPVGQVNRTARQIERCEQLILGKNARSRQLIQKRGLPRVRIADDSACKNAVLAPSAA